MTIDFDEVDIPVFVKFISELTGKNFVIDKGVRGKVTIISPNKISVDEAYKVFESVLDVNGFTGRTVREHHQDRTGGQRSHHERQNPSQT